MALTKEEISQELATNSALKTELLADLRNDILESAKAEGHIIRTLEEEETFLSNYENEKISPITLKFATGIEKDIYDKTGVKKLPNEKYHEYMKRVFDIRAEEISGLKTKIEEGVNKNGDELTRQQLETLKEQLRVALEERETSESTLKSENENIKLNYSIEKGLIGKKIRIPSDIKDEDKQAYEESEREYIADKFRAKYKAVTDEGKLVFKDGEKFMINPKTREPMTVSELIEQDFKFKFQSEEKKPAGTGKKNEGSKEAEVSQIESQIRTKEELYDHAQKMGHTSGSKEWLELVKRIKEANNIE